MPPAWRAPENVTPLWTHVLLLDSSSMIRHGASCMSLYSASTDTAGLLWCLADHRPRSQGAGGSRFGEIGEERASQGCTGDHPCGMQVVVDNPSGCTLEHVPYQ